MNSAHIFNSIHHRDLWSLLRAYNDTIDKLREWTLIGTLPETEKTSLRDMIRNVITGDDRFILDVIDGTHAGAIPRPNDDVGDVLYSCYNYHSVYTKPWICRNHELLHRCAITFSSITEADYVVMLMDGDHDIYIGEKIFPSVAQIILADVSMKRRECVSIIWSQGNGHSQHYGLTYMAEHSLCGSVGISFMHLCDDMIDEDTINGLYTLGEVANYFLEVNQLVHTKYIVDKYLSLLLRNVNGSMSGIIDAIAMSRYSPRDWMAHFDVIPGDDYSDIAIITV